MTVAQYEAEFSRLAKFTPTMVVDEESQAWRFEDELRSGIKQGVGSFDLTTFKAVMSKALLVEMGLMRLKQRKIIARRKGLGKERKALAFKPRNKEHNMLIQMQCQSALNVVGLM